MDKIFRVKKKDNPFVMLDKRIFSDKRLSWKSKGLLGYLLGKPDNWTVMEADLIAQSKDKRDAVRSGIRELERCGYIRRKQLRDSKGRLSRSEYIVYEEPVDGFPVDGFPADGKSPATNNDLTNMINNNNNNDLAEKLSTTRKAYEDYREQSK